MFGVHLFWVLDFPSARREEEFVFAGSQILELFLCDVEGKFERVGLAVIPLGIDIARHTAKLHRDHGEKSKQSRIGVVVWCQHVKE